MKNESFSMIWERLLKRLRYWKRIASAYVINKENSNLSFWHTPLSANELTRDDIEKLRAYPQNFEEKIGRVNTIDANGVILLDYKGTLGLQYNPNAIAQLALGYYDRILSGMHCKDEYLRQATYFLTHGRTIQNDVLLWEYNFPFENRNYQSAPWRSALAQGQGISVCLRAYELGQDEKYLVAAKRAFNSFRYTLHEHPGGVLDDSRGYVWLEEYMFNPPNHVLNGFIWALWGVREYAVFFNDPYAWNLWNDCLKTLEENVCHYDIGFWTSYDLVKFNEGRHPTMPASLYYQRLHSIQMEAMYRLTDNQTFKYYADKWVGQLSKSINRYLSQVWKSYFKLMRF